MSTPTEPIVNDKPASVAETLRAARALIQDPEHWSQGALARANHRSRVVVAPSSPWAHAWCLAGTLRRIDGPHRVKALIVLAETIKKDRFFGWFTAEECIVSFNDAEERRHQDVIRMLDRAIANAEARS